ncbi:MAG: efflux RND transporter periplasmic adaptor subunit [Acidobacteriota bacterium]
MRTRTATVVAGIAAVSLIAAGCKGKGKTVAAPPEVPVRVARIEQVDLPLALAAVGTVEAYNSVAVTPRIAGQILSRHFAEGHQVAAGALLYAIDPAPFEEALRQAGGRLASDQASLEFRRAEAERYAFLVDKGAVSKSEFERTRTEAAALAESVKADQAAVEKARLDLSYCEVRAPISGQTGAYLASAGAVVEAYRTPLVVIHQIRPIKVAFSLPEQQLAAIKQALTAGAANVAALVAGSGQRSPGGRLAFVDNSIDTATGMILLKADFANTDGLLWPGQFVNVTLELGIERGAMVAPAEAIQAGPKGHFTFVISNEGIAELRAVEVERWQDARAVLRGGLAAGELVVTDGHNKLKNGARARIVAVAGESPAGAGGGSGG